MPLLPLAAIELRPRFLIRDLTSITLGVLSAGVGLKSFLIPNQFLDGGVTGLAILASFMTGTSVIPFFIVFNLPFLLLGFRTRSIVFLGKAIIAIGGLAIVLGTVTFPVLTQDKLLIAVFGGFFLGAGIGLSIRGGAVIDGTEVLAIYLSRVVPFSVGDVILAINVGIFLLAAVLLNLETAMYAMLTYLSASKTADFILHGIEESITLLIVSRRSEVLRRLITQKLGKGVTLLKGERGYRPAGEAIEQDVILTVASRLEVVRVREEVEAADPQAFIIQFGVDDIKGGIVKARHKPSAAPQKSQGRRATGTGQPPLGT